MALFCDVFSVIRFSEVEVYLQLMKIMGSEAIRSQNNQ
jgi:hypothetical protein